MTVDEALSRSSWFNLLILVTISSAAHITCSVDSGIVILGIVVEGSILQSLLFLSGKLGTWRVETGVFVATEACHPFGFKSHGVCQVRGIQEWVSSHSSAGENSLVATSSWDS